MKKMKKKIYKSLNLISIIAIILSTILLVLIFYNFHMDKSKESIKNYGITMANYLELSNSQSMEDILNDNSKIRTTLININGDIVFDSNKEAIEMENHIDRPEVQNAISNGTGDSLRHSSTFEKDTYYYAILLSNNIILRVSQEVDNMLSVFLTILPGVFLVFFFIFFISLSLSSLLSSKILKPINNITENMESLLVENELDTLDIYDELLPFIKTLVKQSQEINLQLKDITEKAHIMETIMSSMNEGLVLVDNDKYVLSINNSGVELLEGNNDLSYIKKSFITLCRNLEVNNAIDKVLESKNNHELILNLDENYIYFFISPVFSQDTPLGAVILMVDYTEKYKIDLIRKEFSANVSHELKTPLTSIIGYSEMIGNGMAVGDDITKFASIIKREGDRLLNLVDSIIRLSKIEESKATKDFDSVDIFAIGQNILENLELLAKEKNITFNIKGNSTIANVNKSMIEELIYNLLDNSIKYTNEGGFVTLEIGKELTYTTIKVKDTGIGIPPEDQSRIFERFYMVDKSRSKKTQSTGLGLSIVKHIVEYHDGIINLNSIPNKGTEITIKF